MSDEESLSACKSDCAPGDTGCITSCEVDAKIALFDNASRSVQRVWDNVGPNVPDKVYVKLEKAMKDIEKAKSDFQKSRE